MDVLEFLNPVFILHFRPVGYVVEYSPELIEFYFLSAFERSNLRPRGDVVVVRLGRE